VVIALHVADRMEATMNHHDDQARAPAGEPGADRARRTAALETLIAGLRNAHALEKQSIAVIDAQLPRLGEHPDLKARLSDHVGESQRQASRLEEALEACGSSASTVKDVMMSLLGASQSSVQGFAEDAVLKAVLADTMLENLEIASYRSLLELADVAELPQVAALLQPSLSEEIAMANWLEEELPAITRRYVELEAAAKAGKGAPTS
jgi:ferritin-like metal-binding protein YciE